MSVSAKYPLEATEFALPGDIVPDDGLPKEPTENTAHKTEGIARFISEFQDKPRLEAWLCSYLTQVQALETAIFEVINERTVDAAIGIQLDKIGAIVRQERGGLSDDEYRVFVKTRILINRSNGHASDLIAVLVATVDPLEGTPEVVFTDLPPASFRIAQVTDIGVRDPAVVFALLSAAKPAGVRMLFGYTYRSKATTFTVKAHGASDDAAKAVSVHALPAGGRLASSEG